MKKKSCPFEQEVLNSLASGDLKPGLKKHTVDCPVCKESVSIRQWMGRFQKVSLQAGKPGKKLPEAEFIWEKAFLTGRPDKELVKKALRPLLIPQVLTYVMIIIVPLYFLFAYLPGTPALTSLSTMLKSLFNSFSFLLLPMTAGLFSVIIFIFITGFEPKNQRHPHIGVTSMHN